MLCGPTAKYGDCKKLFQPPDLLGVEELQRLYKFAVMHDQKVRESGLFFCK